MNSQYVHKGKDLTFTLTFQDTLKAIQERRPCSPASLRRYIRKLRIRPLGRLRTNPQHYPADTPAKVLDALGDKVLTMQQLLAIKRQAKKERAA